MNSIFKTGTFGFSTLLSTPCDVASEGSFLISDLWRIDEFFRANSLPGNLYSDLVGDTTQNSL